VTIPGRGDLSPRRHHAPIGRWLATAVVVLLLGAGGYFAFLGLSGNSSPSKPVASPTRCPKPTATAPAAASKVHLVVRNATLRTGLAAQVSRQLKKRGFHVSTIGNTAKMGRGVATIHYGSGRLIEAQAVADQIRGATMVQAAHSGIELDIGPRFRALQTTAAARAARAHLVARETAALSPSPSPTCP
jgi:hypothetical protein